MIPYGRQHINEQDIEAVVEILRSDWLTQGPTGAIFEDAVASYCGATHAVAVCNATAALHIACMALGLGKGDILWTSPNTFVATSNCALYCGASVDFVDIDARTYNMSVDALQAKLEEAERAGRLPKIVVPVHFAGQSCQMKEIKALAVRYGFRIIEDASHAIGGKYLEEPVGNCRFSDITVFSFHPVKIVTTGEGGMCLTNSGELAERLQLFRSHGITRDPTKMVQESEGIWHYQQIELGFNYRMPDMMAALGASQMSRLDEFVHRRHEIARRYDQAFADLPLTTPWQDSDVYSSYHLYPIVLHSKKEDARRKMFGAMRSEAINVNVHYIPVHTQPYYQKLGFKAGAFPVAEKYYRDTISIPMFFGLADEEQSHVIDAITRLVVEADVA